MNKPMVDYPNQFIPFLDEFIPYPVVDEKGGENPELYIVEVNDPDLFLPGYIECFKQLARKLCIMYGCGYDPGYFSFFVWKPEGEVWKYSFSEERWRYDGEWFVSRLLQDGWNFKLQVAVMVGIQWCSIERIER